MSGVNYSDFLTTVTLSGDFRFLGSVGLPNYEVLNYQKAKIAEESLSWFNWETCASLISALFGPSKPLRIINHSVVSRFACVVLASEPDNFAF